MITLRVLFCAAVISLCVSPGVIFAFESDDSDSDSGIDPVIDEFLDFVAISPDLVISEGIRVERVPESSGGSFRLVADTEQPAGRPLITAGRTSWVTPDTVLGTPLGKFISEKFPAFLSSEKTLPYFLSMYVLWCARGGVRCGDGRGAWARFTMESYPSGSHLVAPREKVEFILNGHFSHGAVVLEDRAFHDSVWDQITRVVVPAAIEYAKQSKGEWSYDDIFAPVVSGGKSEFDKAVAAVRASAQPLDPEDPRLSHVPVLIPIVGIARHKTGSLLTAAFSDGSRGISTLFSPISAGEEITVDKGAATPAGFYVRFGHLPAGIARVGEFSAYPTFPGNSSDPVRAARISAYQSLKLPVVIGFHSSGKLGSESWGFFRLQAAESVEEVEAATRAIADGDREQGDVEVQRKVREAIRTGVQSMLRLRPSVKLDAHLLAYDTEVILTRYQRELVRLRAAENSALLATLRANLEEGDDLPEHIFWDDHATAPPVW